MSNPELFLTRINLSGQKYSVGSGSGGLTRQEILAAIGMGHLSRPAWLMAQAYYLAEASVLSELSKCLCLAAVDLANEHGWKVPRGHELLRRMSVLALLKILEPPMCRSCRNDDKRKLNCEACAGTGHRDFPIRFQAEITNLPRTTWARDWRKRCSYIEYVAKGWLCEVESYLDQHASDLRGVTNAFGHQSKVSAPSRDWSTRTGVRHGPVARIDPDGYIKKNSHRRVA